MHELVQEVEPDEFPPSDNPDIDIDLVLSLQSSCLRPVDWRCRLAAALGAGLKLPRPLNDGLASRLASFQKAFQSAVTPIDRLLIAWSQPHLFEAIELSKQPVDSGVRLATEALLLAGASNEQVAQYTGHAAATVALYHDVAFDVRDRLKHPSAIVHLAICRGQAEDHATIVRRMAFFGGYNVALYLLRPFNHSELPPSRKDLRAFMAADVRAGLMKQAVLAVRLLPTDETQVQSSLLRTWMRLQAHARRRDKWSRDHGRQGDTLHQGIQACLKAFPESITRRWIEEAATESSAARSA